MAKYSCFKNPSGDNPPGSGWLVLIICVLVFFALVVGIICTKS